MKNFLKFIGLIFVIIIIASAINSVSKDKNSNVSVDTDKKTEKQQEVKEKKKDYEITDTKIEKDSFSTYAVGVLKNNSDSDKSYVQVVFPVYDKSGNKVGSAMANINDLKANSTWKFKALYLGSEKNVTIKFEEVEVTGF